MRPLLLLLPLLTGCAFGDRLVVLEEYRSSVPISIAPGLAGRTVAIGGFEDVTVVEAKWSDSEPTEPVGFHFREMSEEEDERWDGEVEARREVVAEQDRVLVGWMRNGWGMHTADVRALNPPAEWLADALQVELEARGARVVRPEEAEAADLVVEGTIRYLKVDIYLHNWADLVVDFRIRPRDGDARDVRLHTTGGQMAWSTSGYEFFQCLRRAEQKLMWLLLKELEQDVPAADP